jgi:hypothetical protein
MRVQRPVPISIFTKEGVSVPSTFPGFKFNVKRSRWYEVLWIDAFESQQIYDILRRRGTIVSERRGRIEVDYGEGIGVTVLGIKREPSSISSRLEGFPSQRGEETKHDSTYRFETIDFDKPKPRGIFDIQSGFEQNRCSNRNVLRYHNGYLSNITAEEGHGETNNRTALYLGDLVGIRLIQGIVERRYGLALNQPIPSFSQEEHDRIVRLAQSAIVVNPEGKRRKPNKAEISQLYSVATSSLPNANTLPNRDEMGLSAPASVSR